ncbi:MAG TPA: GNAT family N-acetyltransferase [Sphingomonas sp.]|nr:GNAT family N-acetyltransferase [Sphingomonas sp.]
MTAAVLPIKFQVGARTLWTVRRRLVRVPLSLTDAFAGAAPALPPLPERAHGYLVTSLPEALAASLGERGLFAFVRQRYTRSYVDLAGGFDAYWAALSGNTRSSLKRKTRRVAAASGGALAVRRFRGPDELTDFHRIARAISARTYQERLLDAGLPADDRFVATMLRLAAQDRVRAWVLDIGGAPAAYLYCPADGDSLLYQYLGYDPAYADLSPGSVLQLEALRDLFADGRFARFDFTEGEGRHKRSFATGGVPCIDLLLLRRTLANRAAVTALGAFDGVVALGKRAAGRLALHDLSRALRR